MYASPNPNPLTSIVSCRYGVLNLQTTERFDTAEVHSLLIVLIDLGVLPDGARNSRPVALDNLLHYQSPRAHLHVVGCYDLCL